MYCKVNAICVNMVFIICHLVNEVVVFKKKKEVAEDFFSSCTWNVFLIPQQYM